MKKILVSSCLLGDAVRYDGHHKAIKHSLLCQWQSEGRIVAICPEVAGGLPIPRPPAEIIEARVIDCSGEDVTSAFNLGAQLALKLCQQHEISVAILKESSPSCGSSQVYDGSFSDRTVSGEGVTTQLLRQHGIRVFNENQLEQAAVFLR
ncbi:DUF523 domain-containing protein [Thalassotalea fusca]